MLVDRLENMEQVATIHPLLLQAFQFLKSKRLKTGKNNLGDETLTVHPIIPSRISSFLKELPIPTLE